jgi:hypothetical protein
MMEVKGMVDWKVKEPTREIVLEWLVNVYNDIPENIVKNAWKKMGFGMV